MRQPHRGVCLVSKASQPVETNKQRGGGGAGWHLSLPFQGLSPVTPRPFSKLCPPRLQQFPVVTVETKPLAREPVLRGNHVQECVRACACICAHGYARMSVCMCGDQGGQKDYEKEMKAEFCFTIIE